MRYNPLEDSFWLGFVHLILLPALNIFVLNSLVKLHLAMAEFST